MIAEGAAQGLAIAASGSAFGRGCSALLFVKTISLFVRCPRNEKSGEHLPEAGIIHTPSEAALTDAGFILAGEPSKRDENQFFSADLFYPSLFATGLGLRPHIRVEMSLKPSALSPIARPIASLIGMAQQKPPEVAGFLCVDPVETAADKLSALAWRVHARRRGSADDDPTIIRHVHDLAALKETATASGDFPRLVRKAMSGDEGRGGEATASSDPAALFAGMLERLSVDPLWAAEYQDYVRQVSFAAPGELIGFDRALAAVKDLIALIEAGGRG